MSQDDIQTLTREIREAGYGVERKPNGNYIVLDPVGNYVRIEDGRPLTIHPTPGDHRYIENMRATLRKLGVFPTKGSSNGEGANVIQIGDEATETRKPSEHKKRDVTTNPYTHEEMDQELYWAIVNYVKAPLANGYAVVEPSTLKRRDLLARAATSLDHPEAWKTFPLEPGGSPSVGRVQAAKNSITQVMRRHTRSMSKPTREAVMDAIKMLKSSVQEPVLAKDAFVTKSDIPENAIARLGLSVRTHNILLRANIETIDDLIAKTEGELTALPNFGEGSMDEVRTALASRELRLKESAPPPKPRQESRERAAAFQTTAEVILYPPPEAEPTKKRERVDPADHEAVMRQVELALQVTDVPRWRQYELLAILAKELLP